MSRCRNKEREGGRRGGRNMWIGERVWKNEKIMIMCTYKYIVREGGREREGIQVL